MVPIKYRHDYGGARFNVLISVYRRDGSVAVSHGGIEMGQGINTKVQFRNKIIKKEEKKELNQVYVSRFARWLLRN